MDDSSDDLEFGRQIAALKHDLGKYVAWMSANLDEECWQGPVRDELIDALERDLLRTRTPADGPPEPAWAVWQRLGGALPTPWKHPELHDIGINDGTKPSGRGIQGSHRKNARQ